ncbi:hypothetical protein RHT52_004628 [Salmonella enterica]|nr:hypothetical protein [Salmonella enterica]
MLNVSFRSVERRPPFSVQELVGLCTARVSVSELRAQRVAPTQNIVGMFASQ